MTWEREPSMSSFRERPPLAAAIRSCCGSIILAASESAEPLPQLIWCCLSLEAKITDSSKLLRNPTLLLSVLLDDGASLNKSLCLAEELLLFVGKGRFVGGLRSQRDLGSAHEQEDSICSRKSSFDDKLGSKWEFWICWFWRSCRGICDDGFKSEFIPCISLLQGRIFLKRNSIGPESWRLVFVWCLSLKDVENEKGMGIYEDGEWGGELVISFFLLPCLEFGVLNSKSWPIFVSPHPINPRMSMG